MHAAGKIFSKIYLKNLFSPYVVCDQERDGRDLIF